MSKHILTQTKTPELFIYIYLLFFFIPSVCVADAEQGMKDRGGTYTAYDYEFKFLPPYCIGRVAKDWPRFKNINDKWKKHFFAMGERGRDWIHVHHYCTGCLALSRLQRGLGRRTSLLGWAENEFNYVISKSSPKFILMPEIHLKMGMTKSMLGKHSEAMNHFLISIKLKTDYVPAYLQLINHYQNFGNLPQAIATAKMGLKYSPESQILQEKLHSLESLTNN
jgi:tetratricopeptide (TPR) repeat protein